MVTIKRMTNSRTDFVTHFDPSLAVGPQIHGENKIIEILNYKL